MTLTTQAHDPALPVTSPRTPRRADARTVRLSQRDIDGLLLCAPGLHRAHCHRDRRHPDIRQSHVRPGLAPRRPVLLAISVAGAIAYLLLGAAAKQHHAPGGLYERIFLGLELLWIAIAAIALSRRTQRKQTRRQVQDTKTVTPRNTSNT